MPSILTAVINSLLPTTKPAITSPWPFKYLVAECKTTSAPNSSGLWIYGEQKVLSTITIVSSFSCAIFEIASISQIFKVGLAGVSK